MNDDVKAANDALVESMVRQLRDCVSVGDEMTLDHACLIDDAADWIAGEPALKRVSVSITMPGLLFHGAAGGEVLDRLLALRLAEQAAGAAGHHLPFQPLHLLRLLRDSLFKLVNRVLVSLSDCGAHIVAAQIQPIECDR
mgnify:CR=1 FL=1